MKLKRYIKLSVLFVTMIVVFVFVGCGKQNDKDSSKSDTKKTDSTSSTKETSVISGKYYVDITVENYGIISLELDANEAPITVENFIELARSGFYDGLTFHRIMDGFMIQGGDPLGNGTGGSDKEIEGEFSENGHENNISHVRGVISMARAVPPNSASSQFFIVQSDSTFLDGKYAAFGKVTSGMDVVDAICKDAKPTDDNGTIKAEEQPRITSIKVVE